jgi:hypothetical protein
MSNRLITFGDSFTYGHNLEDCTAHDHQDKFPSKYAWPAVLGSLLDYEVINKSSPGSSNIEILSNILDFKFKSTDLVIVGWTLVHRDLIYKQSFFKKLFNRTDHFRVSVWNSDDISKKWCEVHNDYDRAVRSGLYIEHADLYLRSLNLCQYHFFALDIINKKPIWNHKPTTWINKSIISTKDTALDNMHPGKKSHNLAAKKLFNIINE